MSRDALIRLARTVAAQRDLDGALLCALVDQESGWDPWAIRYEPRFYERYVSPLVANANLNPTEARVRAFSFGLCQILGQTAREAGYKDALPALFDPETNLELGVTILLDRLARADGDRRVALGRYNGCGPSGAYVDHVLARVPRYA